MGRRSDGQKPKPKKEKPMNMTNWWNSANQTQRMEWLAEIGETSIPAMTTFMHLPTMTQDQLAPIWAADLPMTDSEFLKTCNGTLRPEDVRSAK